MAAYLTRFYNSVMKKLLLVLCANLVLILAPLFGEPQEWTNKQGKTINAEFVSATNESVTISMGGKSYVVQLADLSPQSRALAAKLRVQKSTVQEPEAQAETSQSPAVLPNVKPAEVEEIDLGDPATRDKIIVEDAKSKLRTWEAINGNKVEAEFVSNSDGQITLKMKTGNTFKVPLDKLSKADRDFIKAKSSTG